MKRKETDAMPNPLTSFMGSWMTPVIFPSW